MSLIVKAAAAENQTTVIYTVTAAKALYLTSAWLQIINDSGGTDFGYLFYRDDADVFVGSFFYFNVQDASREALSMNFYPNLLIPAAYDICVLSNVAGLKAVGGVTGYEHA